MINHDAASYQDIADAFAGHPVGDLTRDQVLDDISFYWFTNTGVSSARFYWENQFGFFDVKNVPVPAAVSTFAHEIYKVPRSWAERAYPTSSTSMNWTGATTSPPGKSQSCLPRSCALVSSHCASNRSQPTSRRFTSKRRA
jgi:hypothetical protein